MIMQDDRNGSIKPIYQQIREDLLLGFQKTGEARLPSEREICKKYGVCRPTVHKALTEQLRLCSYPLYTQVRQVLDKNKQERHIRGGIATRKKYKGT